MDSGVAASNVAAVSTNDSLKKLKNFATVVYALYASSILFGITSIVGIGIAYLKRSDAKGTWLESHFRWQIRTFWFSVLWGVIGMVVFGVVGSIMLGGGIFSSIGPMVFFVLLLMFWFIYRIVKGWVRLADGKEMYV